MSPAPARHPSSTSSSRSTLPRTIIRRRRTPSLSSHHHRLTSTTPLLLHRRVLSSRLRGPNTVTAGVGTNSTVGFSTSGATKSRVPVLVATTRPVGPSRGQLSGQRDGSVRSKRRDGDGRLQQRMVNEFPEEEASCFITSTPKKANVTIAGGNISSIPAVSLARDTEAPMNNVSPLSPCTSSIFINSSSNDPKTTNPACNV